MSDYLFYDPGSMMAKRRKKLEDKLIRDLDHYLSPYHKEDYKEEKVSVQKPPVVEKPKAKALKEKISNDLNTVLALALEGLDNMAKDCVDDVYNLTKIRDLVTKVNQQVDKET